MSHKIPFNKPFFAGSELKYVEDALARGHISGNGHFTKACHAFFEERFGFPKCLLTTSCTDALEMAAILLNIQPGDEVIIPAYTFVSTANAFVLRGARVIFTDSSPDHPNMDANIIEPLISDKTKAIVVVHYSGTACDMDQIMAIANNHNLFVVEDAAQAIDSYYKGRPLGSIGHLAAFSFHETKNILSGEGGMLVINDPQFEKRAEIIWEKGTNRTAYFKGEVDKYGWVDIGSSFLPSDIIAAILFGQLENLEQIQLRRKEIWNIYYTGLKHLENLGKLKLPSFPEYATNNAHMFYLLCKGEKVRDALIEDLKENNIQAVFHYLSLHQSPFYKSHHDPTRVLTQTDRYSQCLVRLPFYYELSLQDQSRIIDAIHKFFLT